MLLVVAWIFSARRLKVLASIKRQKVIAQGFPSVLGMERSVAAKRSWKLAARLRRRMRQYTVRRIAVVSVLLARILGRHSCTEMMRNCSAILPMSVALVRHGRATCIQIV